MKSIKKLTARFKKHPLHWLLFSSAVVYIPLILLILFSLLPPKVNAEFTLKSTQPIDQPLKLAVWGSVKPNSVRLTTNPSLDLKIKVTKDISQIKYNLEISPQGVFNPQTSYQVSLSVSNWLGIESTKTFNLTTASLPKLLKTTPANQEVGIPANSVLNFEFDRQVPKGDYHFLANPPFPYSLVQRGTKLVVHPLVKLKQGQNYTVNLSFGNGPKTLTNLFSGSFTTSDPLQLVESTPAASASSVLKQTHLKFTFNKPLQSNTFASNFQIQPTTAGTFNWLELHTVEFVPTDNLLTATTYTVSLGENILAFDNSQLPEAKTLTFVTAGPVKVSGISPSGSYFPTNSTVKVSFDQEVDQASAQSKFAISPAVAGSFSWLGNTLIFKPKGLDLLTGYQVNLAAGIKTIGGEDSNQSFSASFTTTGERVVTIGYSVKGGAIKASYFGTGNKKILLVGALHGNESNTSAMLNSWISYLRANQGAIASDRTFVIVPYANPDGTATNNRFNAHNVDLNRNWDLPDWQALSYWGNNSYPNGGGSAPFSEPETQSLRDLIYRENPSRIITYHAAANLVIGGGASNSFASWYSSLTGYGLSTASGETETSCQSALGYCVTGTLEEWAGKRGNPTIVVEFSSMVNSEYSKNLPALKGLLNYSI